MEQRGLRMIIFALVFSLFSLCFPGLSLSHVCYFDGYALSLLLRPIGLYDGLMET